MERPTGRYHISTSSSHLQKQQSLANARGTPQNFWMKLKPQKLEGWCYRMVKVS